MRTFCFSAILILAIFPNFALAEEATLAQAKMYLSSPQDLGEGYTMTPRLRL